MKILFIHRNYPAQFGRIAVWLARNGWDVTYATARPGVRSAQMRIVRFYEHRETSSETHHYLSEAESAVIAGQGLARVGLSMANKGYRPDVVVAHSGWGVGFFVKDVWPEAKYVQYAEWYYKYPYVDRTSHNSGQHRVEESARARMRNVPFWLDFSAADAIISPTHYQASCFPKKVRKHITVLNDGFDTQIHRPAPRDIEFLKAHGIPPEAEIITYIARGMEPTRGFPEAMKAFELLQKKRSNLHLVVIAKDQIAYGSKTKTASWKERMLNTLSLDTSRLHFTGHLPRAVMIKFLQASNTHLYLSAPFVLSWSFVEAMACAAPIVAARSAPVEEFMTNRESGLLVNSYDTNEVVNAVKELIDDQNLAMRLGKAARKKVVANLDGESIAFPEQARFFSNL